MNTADLRRPLPSSAYPAGSRATAAAPDYHALGTFSETWSFLEFFLGRCLSALGEDAAPGLQAKQEALDMAARQRSDEAGSEVATLVAEVRALAAKREAALQELARASLNRMGLHMFAPADAALGPNAVGSPLGNGSKTVEALHMRACDLVRRSALLLCGLEKTGA